MPSRAAVYSAQTPRPFYGPARPPRVATKPQVDTRPRVALLQLQKHPYFDEQYALLLRELSARFQVDVITNRTQASHLFRNGWHSIVLATDQALAESNDYVLRDEARVFVQRGGTLILCCHFAAAAPRLDVEKFFSSFGLYWRSGDYHRTEHDLNYAIAGVDTGDLKPRYSQQAVHLRDVDPRHAMYLPAATAYVQSSVCPPSPIEDKTQTPTALAAVGQGRLGYLGDVNVEEGTVRTMLTLCGQQ
ncbi:hypothetical protein CB0940_00875 [Cercospora beticola]|uniref:ThuA-like domain-containing protein n=1 Tax=Cercospora beticola TaxID=122368 RepID=A0A2G5IBL7_CERBT|nr:hypothetical protein CB0940_00875 [Cercospora beticola]PIB02256.1 hypothetical protein CB0940_00875 [Cercospora beticola]WPA96303.1 hypothetical protein RHO25_000909 [Cercospora beticola]CAK1355398.1 unnamed protein product [Cercospora beticola]